MANQLRQLELSYDFAKVVPSNDPDLLYFQNFTKTFGEDGNMMVIGVADSAVYEPLNFRRFKFMSDYIQNIPGVTHVVSLTNMNRLEKDTEQKTFHAVPIFQTIPSDPHSLDSLLKLALDQRLYSDQLINRDNGAMLMLVALDDEILQSKRRQTVVSDVVHALDIYTEGTGIKLHIGGLPYLRNFLTSKVKEELDLFLILSALVTAVILFIFFRSWNAVVFPMIVIAVMVIWTMGTLALFGYKITLLTGLLGPIIVVIGIPNSIYLLNKYHLEYERHGIKMLALSRVIRKIGIVTLITNFTTAVGFAVLAFTDIVILKEFGIVAGINILATFLVSIILIPAVFSYLPAPSPNQLKHLNFKGLDWILTGLDLLVHRQKYTIVGISLIIALISLFGVSRLNSVSYMADDIPKDSRVWQDLQFFQQNFKGVMPLELVIDTGRRKGSSNLNFLRKVDSFEAFVADNDHISTAISVADFIKAARQAFYNNNPAFYDLPNNQDKNFLQPYLRNQPGTSELLATMVDSTGQQVRVSMKVADIGSVRMDSLLNYQLKPKVDELFGDTDIKATFTGTTLLFIKGNQFLVQNLRISLLLAFLIIALIMALLFANFRMILISLVPNTIPLLITAGVMGFLNIPLKPSTALIFSIAFGISVDDSIHFLAKYRQELFGNNFFVPIAISKSIRETGSSMMYTSIVLFFGFVIFAGSEFGGTVALGILASTTLIIAMFTNLIVLPSLLLIFDSGKRSEDSHPLIEHYDEFYHEESDEEIDMDRIRLVSNGNQENIKKTLDSN
ncbi:MAG: transporter [Cyclobacteriaceae bacterium]|nr:MAG: transporter [Cyclobacteriaceae bacterium]